MWWEWEFILRTILWGFMHVHVFMCTYVYVCVPVCVHACSCICVHLYVHVFVHVCMCGGQNNLRYYSSGAIYLVVFWDGVSQGDLGLASLARQYSSSLWLHPSSSFPTLGFTSLCHCDQLLTWILGTECYCFVTLSTELTFQTSTLYFNKHEFKYMWPQWKPITLKWN